VALKQGASSHPPADLHRDAVITIAHSAFREEADGDEAHFVGEVRVREA
jgi:hypothetical protein